MSGPLGSLIVAEKSAGGPGSIPLPMSSRAGTVGYRQPFSHPGGGAGTRAKVTPGSGHERLMAGSAQEILS